MEVTKTNFKEALPLIKEAISECTFCAIDTELTGLKIYNTEHAFDTMEERYAKLYEISKQFLVIQFGVSCFQYHKDAKKYTHKDFNFYVFPRQHTPNAPDTMFMCQASSLNYLTEHGFDFNKLLHEGISYLKPKQEQLLLQSMKELHDGKVKVLSHEKNGTNSPKEASSCRVPHDHKDFINGIRQQVDTFVASDNKTLDLPPCTAYRRKLIYEAVLPKHTSGISMKTTQKEQKMPFITVSKMTDNEKLEELKQKYASDKESLTEAVGFRHVLQIISDSKKLVIGHNMLLDLLHTIDQFFYSLPQNLNDFKYMTGCIFPHLMDTKTLASSPNVKDLLTSTALFVLWEEIQTKSFPLPLVEPAENFECYNLKSEKMHEAGYDAFITGMCFISLTAKMAEAQKLEYIGPESKILSPYVNRPHVMRHYDVTTLNLNGPDPEPSRDHVFYVTFPKEWKTVDLVELFSPYGEIYVSWLNDISALVALKTPSQVENVNRTLLKSPSSLYKVQLYSEYRDMQYIFKTPPAFERRNRSTHVADPDLPSKRQRTSSGSADGSVANRSITPIPEEEEEENEPENRIIDKQDNSVSTSHDSGSSSSLGQASSGTDCPKPKKQKTSHDDSEVTSNEVTSTDKLFEEPSVW